MKDEGYIINSYDRCVANTVINGKQSTIVWYFDNDKLSHNDPKVNDKVHKILEKHFGKLVITRGKTHDFLGMKINIKGKQIEISMKDQLEEAFNMFGEELSGTVSSPAT